MAKADLKVTIDAEAAKLEREIDRTARSMQRMESQIRRTELQAARLNKELDDRRARAVENFGRGLLAFGAATAVGLGLAVKAAIDWESAWAGVLKTVEGSPEQLARVEEGLRELATTLPATHGEIAAVAEAAGQLGIATDQVVDFTRVMVMLGETTNLSATEAATALARMMNIMGTAPTDVDRLGATIVDLGNNAATTEAEIVEMALRIAGAGATIGLSEQDVLAFATALSSVGIRAEAGGTAISRVMVEIANSVASGGESLDQFATVAGMSASEFAQAFERDPAAAIQTFIAGLGEIDTAGGNVFETLDQLALGDIRVRDALLRMSSASGLLTENLDRSADAWENNTALVEEAERRFDTTEAKIQIAKNTLVDLGIDIGSVLLPAISALAEGAADIFRWFSDLPGPVKTVFTILGTVASAASLAGTAFLLLAPRIQAARAEMQLLTDTSPTAARGMRAAGVAMRGLGIAGAVAAGLILIKQAMEGIAGTSDAVKVGVGEATAELLKLRDGIESDLVGTVVNAKGILEDSFNIDVFGTQIGNDLQELNRASNDLESGMQQIDAALGGMVSGGDVEIAAELFEQVARAWEAGGHDVAELRDRLPGYRDALAEVDNQQELTAESAAQVDQSLVNLSTRFGLTGEDAEKAAQEMLDAWAGATTGFIDIMGAHDTALAAKEEAERETAQATADATADQSDSWEDYIGDVTLSIDEYLAELERQVEAQLNWQENMLTLAGRVSAGTLDELAKLGPEGAPLVEELVNASDEELARFEELMGARSEAGAQNFAKRLAEAEPVLKQIARDEGQEVADSIAAGMAANGSNVFDEAKAQGVNIDEGLGINLTREVPVDVPLPTGLRDASGALDQLTLPRSVTITANFVSGGIGNLLAGRSIGHEGGLVTTSGIQKFHSGGVAAPRLHAGSSRLAADEVPAILQTGEMVLSRAQVAMMKKTRFLELVARGMVRLGDVTDDEWEQLLALGWQGKAGDRMEALYPPLEGARREFIKLGEVTKTEWERLMRLGWQGKAGDRMEALYPPLESLAVESGKAAKLLRDANLSRIGVSGGRRTYDFFRSGGKSFAHIFGTGETLALGQMGEMQAGDFLRAMGKIPKAHQGGHVVGADEGLAVLQRGETILSRKFVDALRLMPLTPVLPSGVTRGGDGNGGGHFTGNLFLSSGEFLGMVQGEVRHGISESNRALKSRTRAGTGRAR